MRPLLTRDEARAMDQHAVTALAMSSLVLMENAGRGAADRILARHGDALRRVVLVGGRGQNGGDAWVVARHLELAGVRTTSLFVAAPGEGPTGDAATNLETLARVGGTIHRVEALDSTALVALDDATLIVDGLFGTGLARPIEGLHAAVVERIGRGSAVVVALDLPSGIDADTGEVLGVAIRARTTLTFGHAKRGLFQGEGALRAGAVEVLSIGAPLPRRSTAELLDEDSLRALVPPRRRDAHKGDGGHVVVVAGSPGTLGASLLAARGASRAGAGLVTLAARPETRQLLDLRVLESMTHAYEDLGELLAFCEGKRAVVVGPGLGRDDAALGVVEALVQGTSLPLVLDADALNLVADVGLDLLKPRANVVLSPHPGEAARLLGLGTAEVQRDRHRAAAELAWKTGACVVLKGAGSIIAAVDGSQRVCSRGTPAMATGGSGDVLAGMIGAMVRSGSSFDDVSAAVLLHALAGEAAASADRGLLASEIADAVPAVLGRASPR